MNDQNKVKYNLKNVHYAKMVNGDVAADKTAAYETPKPIPGAVNLSLAPQGSSNPFYADGVVYFQSNRNSGYNGDLEIAKVPDDFKKDILGFYEDGSGCLVENADAPVVHFALLFEFDGDKNSTRHVMYNTTATRPQVGSTTNTDSSDPQTEAMTCNCATIKDGVNNKNIVKASCATGDSAYDGWYENVHLPTKAADDVPDGE